jgi:hypothetical protein
MVGCRKASEAGEEGELALVREPRDAGLRRRHLLIMYD